MRIAIINWSSRRVGGVETYLNNVIPKLALAGHEVAFWCEVDRAGERERIELPTGSPLWCVEELGAKKALAALSDWRPHVIYAHSLREPELESETLKVAPAVFFAHAYYGTCISGSKTFKSGIATPCHRRFGWQCLAHYYPHRCGGLNPLTMMKEYRRQSQRLELLWMYKAIVTISTYMRNEYIKHGLNPERVHCLSYDSRHDQQGSLTSSQEPSTTNEPNGGLGVFEGQMAARWQLLFLGRMDFLKGGQVLIDALPRVCAALNRPVSVTFAGDGTDRDIWEHQARQIQRQTPGLEIEFVGWVTGQKHDALLSRCHLLVLPSVWPEPFGLVGPEAGVRGMPAVAFDVGGITDWLTDGLNGYLASGTPPTSKNLADAIVKCLNDPVGYAKLRQGALEKARQFKLETHLASLLKVLGKVVQEHRPTLQLKPAQSIQTGASVA